MLGAVLFGVVWGWLAGAATYASRPPRAIAVAAVVMAGASGIALWLGTWWSALLALGGVAVGWIAYTVWRGQLKRLARHNR